MADTSISDMSTRAIIIRNFAQAGPWALLAVLVIGAVGYQANWFITEYIKQTSMAISTLTNEARDNRLLIIEARRTTEAVFDLMTEANRTMEPVARQRAEQTQLLREIKEILQEDQTRLREKP